MVGLPACQIYQLAGLNFVRAALLEPIMVAVEASVKASVVVRASLVASMVAIELLAAATAELEQGH